MFKLSILGIRGIPAQHGGFETFAENLSLFLVQKGWDVTVYCQEEGNAKISFDEWKGVRRIHIPVTQKGALGTIVFDWRSILDARKKDSLILTLGYNTAVFCFMYRLKGLKNIINMDGLEWRRSKWRFGERAWLYFNEKIGSLLGNHLIADHPEIEKRLVKFVSPLKVTFIPYSAKRVTSADHLSLNKFDLTPNKYTILIARPEPENSILEIVLAYSRIRRKIPLVILGDFNTDSNAYHKKVVAVAGDDILFTGAIYEKSVVDALRFFARFYIHGHTVGGTNPSLVEALGAGSAVLAHNNPFNRWVAGKGAVYFSNQKECEKCLNLLLEDDDLISKLRNGSEKKYFQNFTHDKIHGAYESVLKKM